MVCVLQVAGTDPRIEALASLFEAYRCHYGQPPRGDESRGWLEDGIRGGDLRGFLALDGAVPIGMALAASTPASLRLSHFWQLRDLFVDPAYRGRGAGRELVAHVCAAARADGALRVSLTTEVDNDTALELYASMGFEAVPGFVGLAVDLADLPGPAGVGQDEQHGDPHHRPR